MRVLLIATLLTCPLIFTGCGESSENYPAGETAPAQSTENASTAETQSETPRAAAAEILKLLEAEDYDTLIRERYSEWTRILAMPESPSPEQIIEQMAPRLAKQRDALLGVYTQLADAEFNLQTNPSPQPGETDQMGTANVTYNGQDLEAKLYLMENGRWGFHL
ncbi:MAG: hypothetical protein AAF593_06185 [Planctomycetota bacterium]